MAKQNIDIRTQIMENGITQYDLAKALGVTPSWISRLLREPLSSNDKQRFLNAIEEIKEGA